MSIFGCALDCGDGRCQGASRKWQKFNFQLKEIDKITVAGLVKQLAKKDPLTMTFVRSQLYIYLTKHNSSIVTISAHSDCAGNRTSKKKQLRALRKSGRIIRSMINSFDLDRQVEIHLLWINGSWMPEEINSQFLAGKRLIKT